MKKVSISIHAIYDFTPNIIEGLKGLDYIHVDVFDGIFVDNKHNNIECFKMLKAYTDIPIIAHLMVKNPQKYIKEIIDSVDIFEFHFEADGNIQKIIDEVKTKKKQVGIAINPSTPILKIIQYLDKIDLVLVMAVVPGWSGQKFMPEIVVKVNELAEYKKQFDFEIEVDGGVNLKYAKKMFGADILCSASYIFNSENPNLTIKKLKETDIVSK